MISHIFFDLDNTMYSYEQADKRAMDASLDYLEGLTGISHSELKKVFDEARHDVKEQQGLVASSHSRLLYFKK